MGNRKKKSLTCKQLQDSHMLTWTFSLLKVVWLWHKYASWRITAAGSGSGLVVFSLNDNLCTLCPRHGNSEQL